MTQAEDTRGPRGQSIEYREFAAFPDIPLASQWKVLERLEAAMAQHARSAAPEPRAAAGRPPAAPPAPRSATAARAPAAAIAAPPQPDAAPNLFRRYGGGAAPESAEPRLADLFRRPAAGER